MTSTNSEPSCSCYFETMHEQHTHPAMRTLEKAVLGCDFGGTSWTTRSQADKIPQALGLGPGTNLLEIGAGTGWPGLYMASQSGCEVTLLDIPVNALRQANQRAEEEKVESICRSVAASGTAMPFAAASFNAIGHSDVLCCLPDKLEMLKECRRVITDNAKMLFYVIAPKRGLSGPDLVEACEVGPPFVGVPDNYEALLDVSGWMVLENTDLTDDYLQALNRFVTGLEAGATEIRKLQGNDEFIDHLARRRSQIDAIERGLLERELFLVEAI
jgi:ubiquinone/menaquinone biosynthesis C-methylase UbiE